MFCPNAVGISLSPVAEIVIFATRQSQRRAPPSAGLQNQETKRKTVRLIALKMDRMDNFKTRSKPLVQTYRASFFEL